MNDFKLELFKETPVIIPALSVIFRYVRSCCFLHVVCGAGYVCEPLLAAFSIRWAALPLKE
jgi:hypothetical protein